MNTKKLERHVVTDEVFEAFIAIKNKYVHDAKSFRDFSFYLSEFNQKVRTQMNDDAVKYQIADHFKAAGEALGESRVTIYRATKI